MRCFSTRSSRIVLCSVVASCLFALAPTRALAQAAPPAAPPPPPAREGSAEFAFIGTTGNAENKTINLGGEFIVRPDQWVVRNKVGFVRNMADGAASAESLQYLFRGDRALSPRTSAFGEYSYFRDEFSGVSNRNSLVAGVSQKLVNHAPHALSVDAGLGYLNEQRTTDPDVSSGTYSFGAAYRWKLSPTAELSEDARFTGLFSQASDWRMDETLAITARLTGLFSLKASNTVRYANAPVSGFKTTDTITAIALVAKF